MHSGATRTRRTSKVAITTQPTMPSVSLSGGVPNLRSNNICLTTVRGTRPSLSAVKNLAISNMDADR